MPFVAGVASDNIRDERVVTVMPYRNMSIDDLARHLGMDARLVKKWAERGRLPGTMVQGEWRFNRAQMLDWLQREMHTLDEEHLANLERAMSDGTSDAIVGELLATEGIDMNLPARSRACRSAKSCARRPSRRVLPCRTRAARCPTRPPSR
jgi:excisionase family DNA binding protein